MRAAGPRPLRSLRRRVAPAEAGLRVSDALRAWLRASLGAPPPKARVRALLASGGVRVDGVVCLAAGRPLRAGQQVEARVRPELLVARGAASDRPFALTAASVLYRDGCLIAVDKPPGLPTHPTADPTRPSLVAHVRRHLRETGAGSYLAVHQRLDRDTSGVVLFATDPRANAGLARAFADRTVRKVYLALVSRPPGALRRRLHVDAPLAAPGPGGGRRVVVRGEGGLSAETEVVVREVLPRELLVEARPRTGRKHQVRAHLAHAGMPVLGDATYGGRAAPRTMLHAWRLRLPHPLSGEDVAIESPPPADFAALLRRLRG